MSDLSITVSVKARRKSPGALHAEIMKAVREQAGKSMSCFAQPAFTPLFLIACNSVALCPPCLCLLTSPLPETLVLIDTLHPLATLPEPFTLATYLSSLLALSPQLSLLAVYHLDIPLPSPPQIHNPYQPPPLTTLRYLCTTILTLHSLSHTLARRRARDRSLAEPVFGVQEEKEGVLLSVKDRVCADDGGMVLEIEHRRKSGRVVGGGGMIYLPSPESTEKPMMLEEHPLFRALRREDGVGVKEGVEEGEIEGTFELGLTEKQRREREGVVLPYFDAQKGEGPGQGGRILYDMGVEDDFDEEEDEI